MSSALNSKLLYSILPILKSQWAHTITRTSPSICCLRSWNLVCIFTNISSTTKIGCYWADFTWFSPNYRELIRGFVYDPTFAPDFDCIFVKTRYMKAKAWLILKAVKLWLAVALLWLIAAILFVAHVTIGIIKLIFIITLFPLTWVVYVPDQNIYNRIKIQLEELLS